MDDSRSDPGDVESNKSDEPVLSEPDSFVIVGKWAFRNAFSRDYTGSCIGRKHLRVYNWYSKHYDMDEPSPSYSSASFYSYPRRTYSTRNTIFENTDELCYASIEKEKIGKEKATVAKVDDEDGDGGAGRPTASLRQNLHTWLQTEEAIKAMRDEQRKDLSPTSETSTNSTYQSSIFDSESSWNESTDRKSVLLEVFTRVPNGQDLPCEFLIYDSGCEEAFGLDDVESWIEHITFRHFHGILPPKCCCWFCDGYTFDSNSCGDPRISFEARMWHIRTHILQDGVTVHDIRPDYHVLDHARRHQLVSEATYKSVRGFSEVPKPSHIRPFDFTSPEAERRDELAKTIIENEVTGEKMRRRPYIRRRMEINGERRTTKDTPTVHGLNSSPASEARSHIKPSQLGAHKEDQGKARARTHNSTNESPVVGLKGLNQSPNLVASVSGDENRPFKSQEDESLNSLKSKARPISLYNDSRRYPLYRTNMPRSSSWNPTSNTAASRTSKKPKITYGHAKNRSRAKLIRSCSSVLSVADNSRSFPSRESKRGVGWTNIFSATIIPRLHLLSPRLFARLHRLFWPRLLPHLVRVSWTCRCGHPLYIDVSPTQRQLAIEYAQAASGSSSSINASGTVARGNSPGQTSSSLSSPTIPPDEHLSNTTGPEPGEDSSKNIFTPPVLAPGTKKYLLLCVNTGHYEIKLEQIDLTNVVLDVSLFSLLREKYEAMRGPLLKNMLLVPKTVEYIKFELMRRSSTGECVGNYEKNSIPGQIEVTNKEYAFSPCPPRIGTLPIQPHIFMHSFLNPGDHLGELALIQLPKKVGRKLKCVTQPRDPFDIPYGWGIYIVEGLNTLLVSLLLTCAVASMTLIVLLWSALKSDVQGGTGIGQYGLAVMGAIVAIGTLSLEPLKGLTW